MKYIIISANNPSIIKGTADLSVLCESGNGNKYWLPTNESSSECWIKFETREAALEQASGIYSNYWIYGIKD